MEVFQSKNDGKVNSDSPLLPKTHKHKPKKLIYHQTIAFAFTALVYCFIHSLRTVWAYSKPSLTDSNPYFTSGKLGALDFAFMLSYAFGQYVNGWLGDRINLKVFLSAGTICALIGFCLFGILEGFAAISNIYVDVLAFILNGIGQSTGYPVCVSMVTFWFSPDKMGLLFGFWGTSLNIGNIIGQQIGRATIESGLDWQYGLFFTSGILAILVICLLIFVRTHPKDLEEEIIKENTPEDRAAQRRPKTRGISFFEAWKLENIPYYALGFFCVKGVMYGVMFWLPFYLTKEVGLEGDISWVLASIEIGMILGSIVIGFGSDRLKSRGIAIMAGFYFAVIFLILTFVIKSQAVEWVYFLLLLAAGFGIGGPNSLIGSAVSADIGHTLSQQNINATSTITGIMEGCGALGAALTQLLVSNFTGITFPLFACLCFIGGCLMIPIVIKDFKDRRRRQLNLSVRSSSEV